LWRKKKVIVTEFTIAREHLLKFNDGKVSDILNFTTHSFLHSPNIYLLIEISYKNTQRWKMFALKSYSQFLRFAGSRKDTKPSKSKLVFNNWYLPSLSLFKIYLKQDCCDYKLSWTMDFPANIIIIILIGLVICELLLWLLVSTFPSSPFGSRNYLLFCTYSST